MTSRRSIFALALTLALFAIPALAQSPLDNPAALSEQAPATYKVRFDTSKGVFVVTSTRTGSGRVAAYRMPPQPATQSGGNSTPAGQRPRGLLRIAAEDLAPVKARILLMLALTQTKDPAEIQRMFTQY